MTAARIRNWIPENAVRPTWSSSAFLFYLGALVLLVSTVWLLESLNGPASDFGLVASIALAMAAFVAAAVLLRRVGMTILAGLAAFIGLLLFAAWVGSIFDWAGWGPDDSESFFHSDFELVFLVVEALVFAAGLLALRVFRFPLLVLPLALIVFFGLVDNLSLVTGDPGDDAHAVFSIIVGLLLVAGGVWLDRSGRAPYAFWPHAVGGFTVGGGILELLGNDDWGWALGGLIALAYIAVARVLARSTYAVIGAIGVLVVGSHFIEKWYSSISLPFFFEGSADAAKWKGPLSYLVLGLILVVLGLIVERGVRLRRRGTSPTITP